VLPDREVPNEKKNCNFYVKSLLGAKSTSRGKKRNCPTGLIQPQIRNGGGFEKGKAPGGR